LFSVIFSVFSRYNGKKPKKITVKATKISITGQVHFYGFFLFFLLFPVFYRFFIKKKNEKKPEKVPSRPGLKGKRRIFFFVY
jgi:hypothetical protein